ncbi:hypothetical protein [Paraburkholderia sp. BR13444]|uniref:hypothetical protein n=1 Tax=Paraburkholderia sp. BR13444 TaxID=3236997 RepID=UPI0034CEF627
MRSELLELIETLSALEHWPKEDRAAVLTRAVCGPLSDLLPNVRYFEKRLIAAQCKAAGDELRASRSWHGEGLDDRMTDKEPTTCKRMTRSRKARVPILDRIAVRVRRNAT